MLQPLNTFPMASKSINSTALKAQKAPRFGNTLETPPAKTANELREASRHTGFMQGLLLGCSLAAAAFTFLVGDTLLTTLLVKKEIINQSLLQREGLKLKSDVIKKSLGLDGMEEEAPHVRPERPAPFRHLPKSTMTI